jgi:hypothetical protein
MLKWAITAHVVIAFLTLCAAYLGHVSYSFGCFYSKKPFGSACNGTDDWFATLQSAVSVLAALYGLWGLILAARWAGRKFRVV